MQMGYLKINMLIECSFISNYKFGYDIICVIFILVICDFFLFFPKQLT
jgi:hypothetical protein